MEEDNEKSDKEGAGNDNDYESEYAAIVASCQNNSDLILARP